VLDSIYIGMSGLLGYSRGLRVISNNVANLNTPGFKASHLQFADLFSGNGASNSQGGVPTKDGTGIGVNTLSTTLSFTQGEFRQTGNSLDLALNGDGLFVERNDAGELRYTRAGQFEFNSDGILVDRSDGSHVLALDDTGKLTEITVATLKSNTPKATATVNFQGNLSTDATADFVVDGVNVFDAAGGQHTLKLSFHKEATAGTWTVTVNDGTTVVGSGQVKFVNGVPDPAASTLQLTYKPDGVAEMPLSFDFQTGVTSFAAGTTSTLAFAKQDGFGAGSLTSATFGDDGKLALTYSNGQTAHGARLAIARFDTTDGLQSVGGNKFASQDIGSMHIGAAGSDGFAKVSSGVLELSNVDLSQEFGDLIVTQRGYQASSQIVSTANEMIQQLFDMKSRR